MGMYCFGIDVGGTTIKCGLFNHSGEILDKWEIPTRTEDNGSNILPDVAKTILAKIEQKHLDKADIDGIGIGVPGPVNDEGEVPVAVNLHWGYMNIVAEMERMTSLRTKAGNDADVAALGEMWKGGGAGYRNLILVTLGTGVGGGIIVNEKIISGIKRISKPGLRVYAGSEDMPKVLGGLGIAIVSTNKGVITDKEARKQHVGGEVLAFVW